MKKLIFFTLIIVILGAFYLYTEIYTRGITNKPTQQGKDVLKKPTPAEVTNTSHSPRQEVVGIVPKDDTVIDKDDTVIDKDDTVTKKESTNYDWRNDESPGKLPLQKDPFGDFIAEQQAKERGTWIGDPETMDPDELHSAEYNQLLDKFGDIPQVHTYMEYSRKTTNNAPMTLDERIAGLEAMNHLFPSGSTRRTLVFYQWMKTKGGRYEAVDQILTPADLKHLRDSGIKVDVNEKNREVRIRISTK